MLERCSPSSGGKLPQCLAVWDTHCPHGPVAPPITRTFQWLYSMVARQPPLSGNSCILQRSSFLSQCTHVPDTGQLQRVAPHERETQLAHHSSCTCTHEHMYRYMFTRFQTQNSVAAPLHHCQPITSSLASRSIKPTSAAIVPLLLSLPHHHLAHTPLPPSLSLCQKAETGRDYISRVRPFTLFCLQLSATPLFSLEPASN